MGSIGRFHDFISNIFSSKCNGCNGNNEMAASRARGEAKCNLVKVTCVVKLWGKILPAGRGGGHW